MGQRLEIATPELAREVDALRRADARLGRRLAAGRQPNETDRAAMRLITEAPADRPVTPRDLAGHLGVSTAAVTSVLRRLAERGQVVVSTHPQDARSKIVRPSLRDLHSPADEISRRVEGIESEFTPDQLAVISRFLRRLTEEISDLT
ncbi:MarR family transcriptional regulator [Microbacterium sp.]|uniref:MarR family winged helix-turn-helix transcriptional regulator n=1 Tax=Microbacterium sp. TaxID=51671 RepID=UPI00261EBCF5|nr:MarR family transcriptional regulator [Microbacterium sp.]MCV0336388.1 MarR family transcriptional regulator [Microbacterium sp.]MCV0376674.1 MarR family transcriptional regulator [Microbacterium sp.]MCV0391423.1 MarR family transcriptional regulator [Microbacterium sp.]MCV0420029.1 MarR family transcriptional regulator [Microbacterium sp.]MCV0423800.1 MarR family transcriptional regulator [Microbacterium sp.]